MTPAARAIAHAITMNCDSYESGTIDRAEWHDIQHALWQEAARQFLIADVLEIVCPSVDTQDALWNAVAERMR